MGSFLACFNRQTEKENRKGEESAKITENQDEGKQRDKDKEKARPFYRKGEWPRGRYVGLSGVGCCAGGGGVGGGGGGVSG